MRDILLLDGPAMGIFQTEAPLIEGKQLRVSFEYGLRLEMSPGEYSPEYPRKTTLRYDFRGTDLGLELYAYVGKTTEHGARPSGAERSSG